MLPYTTPGATVQQLLLKHYKPSDASGNLHVQTVLHIKKYRVKRSEIQAVNLYWKSNSFSADKSLQKKLLKN